MIWDNGNLQWKLTYAYAENGTRVTRIDNLNIYPFNFKFDYV